MYILLSLLLINLFFHLYYLVAFSAILLNRLEFEWRLFSIGPSTHYVPTIGLITFEAIILYEVISSSSVI